jgi:hypothetical protein
MNKEDVRLCKAKILKCLTEDFEHGKKRNPALFDKQTGRTNYSGTDLDIVMDAVVLGLYLALADSEGAVKV